MTKSKLIETIVLKQTRLSQKELSQKDIDLAIKTLLEQMALSLENGERIEIRGFGSFSLHHRSSRKGRNPKTGAPVILPEKYVPHFKAGKELRDRVNIGGGYMRAK